MSRLKAGRLQSVFILTRDMGQSVFILTRDMGQSVLLLTREDRPVQTQLFRDFRFFQSWSAHGLLSIPHDRVGSICLPTKVHVPSVQILFPREHSLLWASPTRISGPPAIWSSSPKNLVTSSRAHEILRFYVRCVPRHQTLLFRWSDVGAPYPSFF